MILRRLLFVIAMLAAGAGAALAQTPEQRGQQIAARADAVATGFGDLQVSGEMTLRTPTGATSSRRFAMKTLELGGGRETRSLLVFDWPGDIRGTALLTHAFDNRQDSQWLYLPSVGRVKKITGGGRSGSFVGSEFAYEDMVEQDVASFSHLWLRDEPCPNGAGRCHLLQRTPRYSSGYAQQLVWIDTAALRYQAVAYFNRRGQRSKTLTMSGYRQYGGRYWRPARMTMVNHLTGKSTILEWSGYRFNTGLRPGDFTREAMAR
ncbi:outer membrane lipoprotein-sorting protein [Rhodovulum adriaticum]|uniref:Outer membrane lipoprotein-sorting protein n=1 Tax=Rhodovulum adriaticum TaxID=35804 RepID=A0A4R2NI96_RHOAD|nr:outer membrane lipoprotein-sorting protein [Rhodovulum adriaticum]MBK1635414.1 hypothetical protein [Rhodovulum adriaticum]TCP21121.1 outer membrane lipoprotein-sorting protein [Rhodovulum adriaticum]